MEHVELPGEIRCGKSTAPIRKIIVLQTTYCKRPTLRVFRHGGKIFLQTREDGVVRPGVVSFTLNQARLGPGLRT
jgi:hypothetical protein